MHSFWDSLSAPFVALAPMDGITDPVFRQIVTSCGKPDVLFTEFVSADGLVSEGRGRLLQHLLFHKNEHPIVAQLFGNIPDHFFESAKLVHSLGFDGIDINMGCPDSNVVNRGGGAGLIKTPDIAAAVIDAVKQGAGGLPVSVKTRIGYDEVQVHEWIPFLLSQDIAVLSVHLRTLRQMYKGGAQWEYMKDIMAMRDQAHAPTKIIASGDIQDLHDVQRLHEIYRCNGYMIGRAAIKNPWVFNPESQGKQTSLRERLETFSSHLALFDKMWAGTRNPSELKKFCTTYTLGMPDATSFRTQFMNLKTLEELREYLENYLSHST
ncbi:tRNA-dihydrouridine synthase [Candidatus Gottesmanbacteria bacterium]|nr:tRNA-dihydrouridine synthase [Candidatus Gottesmanbacteria bacterium]